MYADAGPPELLPEPPPPPRSPASARYGYLVARLRNRQITMEEATELFEILQDALSRPPVRAAPPPREPSAPRRTPPSPPGGRAMLSMNDETLSLSLLAFGAGAGLLAAILKRGAEGPRSARSQ